MYPYKEYPKERKVFEIFRFIKSGKATSKELSETFGVSTKTIKSYIKNLREVWEVDIEYDSSKRKYVIYSEGLLGSLKSTYPITAEDINLILYNLIESKQLMPTKMTIIQNSLIGLLSDKEKKAFKSIFTTVSDSDINDSDITRNIKIIKDAIVEKKKIKFQYRAESNDVYKVHLVTPCSFAHDSGKYYLIGKRGDKDGLTHYRIDRMISPKRSDEYGEIIENFSVEEHLKRTWSMYGGKETKIKVKFHKSVYKPVTEKQMMQGELVEELQDYFVYEFIANGTDGILIWLLGFGDKATILEPLELRNKAKNIAMKMLDNYKG